MKVQAPRSCRAISVGGAEIVLGEAGIVEVPDRVGHDLLAYHGFKKAGPVADLAAAARQKAGGKPAK